MESNKKKPILYLIIFSIICIAITITLIYLTNEGIIKLSQKENIKKEQISIVSDGLGIKSLKDKYTINSIKIKYEKYYSGKKKEEDIYYPIDITYAQISGLKNKTIQDQINKEIKDTVFAQVDEKELNRDNVRNIIVTATCEANFSNILSINFSKETVYEDLNSEIREKLVGLNYDLSTGEKINFTDLFTNDAGTKNIIYNSAYMTFANEYLENYELVGDNDWDGDMSKIDYSSMEERVLKVLQNYDRNNEYEFYFDEKNIYVDINDEQIEIDMKQYYKQIAIYNRYVGKERIV